MHNPERFWRVRRPRQAFRSWWTWRQQGRPTDEPVVLVEGVLEACPHAHGTFRGWTWDMSHQEHMVEAADLWDRYSARYPVHRVPALSGCELCG